MKAFYDDLNLFVSIGTNWSNTVSFVFNTLLQTWIDKVLLFLVLVPQSKFNHRILLWYEKDRQQENKEN